VQNRGLAFNLERFVPEPIRKPLFAVAVAAMLAVVVARLRKRQVDRPNASSLALILIGAGAVGNLLDRLTRGYVVDFVRVGPWPIFNVADVLICIGVGLLLVSAWPSVRTPSGA
jgi:signal peptidase II